MGTVTMVTRTATADFVNVTAQALGPNAIPGKVALGDFNNDGLVDIYSAGRLWRNTGTGFMNDPAGSPLNNDGIFGDYDKDGFLDFFSYESGKFWHNNAGSSFTYQGQLYPARSDAVAIPPNSRGATWGDLNGDTYPDLYVGGGEWWPHAYYNDRSFMNNQDGTFTETLITAGQPRPARGITAADWDQDGDLDVYVSNYRLEPNQLWRNDGNGNLSDVAGSHNATASTGHSIGSVFGDFNNDGLLDIFAGNFAHPGQPQSRFLLNNGPTSDYTFTDTGTKGVTWVESYSSPTAGDIDNDGDLDLYFAAIYPGDRSKLWRNQLIETGNLQFTELTASWNLGTIVTYQAAFGDYNDDGMLDLVTGGKLFRNDGVDGSNGNQSYANNHWLKVKLDGNGLFDASAIGAQVRIPLSNGMTLTRQVEGSVGESNQNDISTLHFGLGMQAHSVAVQVRWPNGAEQWMVTSGVDHTVTISPGGSGDLFSGNWITKGSGTWGEGANWSRNFSPNGAGATATLGDVIIAPSTIEAHRSLTIGELVFDSPFGYQVQDPTGLNQLTLEADDTVASIQVLQGDHHLDIATTVIGKLDVAVTSGSISFNTVTALNLDGQVLNKTGAGALHLGSIAGGGTVTMAEGVTYFSGIHFGGGLYGVQSNAIFVAEGVILGELFNFGLTTPGKTSTASQLAVAVNYVQGNDAILQLDIFGHNDADMLAVTQNLHAAGTFQVLLAEGYTPQAGDQFTVLSFGTVSGAFDAIELPALSSGLAWNVNDLLIGGGLEVVNALLYGDANNNGQVTGADLIAVQQNFGNTSLADGLLIGDANDDGKVTGADLITVQQNFGTTLVPGSAVVPEPATAGLFALLLIGRRRAR